MTQPKDRNTGKPRQNSGKKPSGPAEQKRLRLAEALRANLKRRKGAGEGAASRAGPGQED
jgi:hypothetical protein